jgi:hypothetical protein
MHLSPKILDVDILFTEAATIAYLAKRIYGGRRFIYIAGQILPISKHYYNNFNRGGHKGFTEAVFVTASDQRSRLM